MLPAFPVPGHLDPGNPTPPREDRQARLQRVATRAVVEAQTTLAWLIAQGWMPSPVDVEAVNTLNAAAEAPFRTAILCPGCEALGWVHRPACPVGGFRGVLSSLFASPTAARFPDQALAMGIAPEDGLYLVRLAALPQRFVPRPETSMLVSREQLRDVPRDALVWRLPREAAVLFDPTQPPGRWGARGFSPLPWPEGAPR